MECKVWSVECKVWSVAATPQETKKTSISYETSSNFDIFDTLSNTLECHKVPRLPRKTT